MQQCFLASASKKQFLWNYGFYEDNKVKVFGNNDTASFLVKNI
jgi:hypothetical protein